ncbi:MAG: uracil-DNA glycosylase [Gammaproteobacteria bacterium]|nr:uracil-DNA glycosylase [Gammaproteobacteria bacterium]
MSTSSALVAQPNADVAPLEQLSTRGAMDGDSWVSIQNEVSQCTACPLHQGRQQTVFGVGDIAANWLIVGEAPGAEEDRKGEPFVGRAGQLLDSMLAALGVTRNDVFITNVVKCRPPSNRDPKTEEMTACASYLDRQIEFIKPQLILAVGRVAAHRLLDTDAPLGRLRGQVHEYQALTSEGDVSIPVVATYHPAYLLRSPSQKRKAWEDLVFAQQWSPPKST